MSDLHQTIIDVVVPLPLDTAYTYFFPSTLGPVQIGMRVLVPFGRRTLTAYVIGFNKHPTGELKEVLSLLDPEPLFTKEELEFFRWGAGYYLHPLGEVIKAALPAGINIVGKKRQAVLEDGTVVNEEVLTGGRKIKRETFFRPIETPTDGRPLRGRKIATVDLLRELGESPAALLRKETGIDAAGLRELIQAGWIEGDEREVYRDPFREEVVTRDNLPELTADQACAVESLTLALDRGLFSPFLLHGVTGSGKTEVYLRAISHALAQGRTALVMVPEIALTPQLVRRFRSRFGSGIAVLHSGLTPGERFDEWRRIRRGEATMVIGARSAIFAPLERIGIIVVDEEHEASYKQAEGFRYNARDLALVRGKMLNACVVLGSATPQISTRHATHAGRLGYLHLPCRVRELPMPETVLIDIRGRKSESLSPELVKAMARNLEAGGQTLLFLNRRGFATYLVCQDCGYVFRCPNCAVTLTHHRKRGRHFCHYCDHSIPAPSLCPECEGGEIALLGRGTERVEDEVREIFPDACIARMDRDTTAGRGGHNRILKRVEQGEIDILVGTQMIAKGHDFPGVTLVGVISADASLNLPDFRSAERTFQLLTQVSGRAGRGDQLGIVMVQSLSPDHYAISRALAHDFHGFYEDEIKFRSELDYPPFSHIALLEISGNSEPTVDDASKKTAFELSRLKPTLHARVTILGPAAAPLGMLRGRHRRQILLKAKKRNDLHRLIKAARDTLDIPGTVRLTIDIDPVDML